MTYPSTSTDEEIHAKILADSNELQRTEYETHSIIRLTGQILLGQNELQKRMTEKVKLATESSLAVIEQLKNETEEAKIATESSLAVIAQLKDETTQLRQIAEISSKTSARMAWFSIGIGIASVIIAITAAWLTYQANQIASKTTINYLESKNRPTVMPSNP